MHLKPIHFVLFALSTIWIWIVRQDPFFWDTVQLGSKHAHFFYQNGLRWQVLPTDIDSGHPPVFGYYLAACWTLFGKSLPVSHWAMWPFLFGVLYWAYQIGSRWSSPTLAAGFVLLLLADPVIATQASMISPDLVLLFFFLCTLHGIWTDRPWLVMVGVLGLCTISMRGMMTGAALALWVFLRDWRSLYTQPALLFVKALPFFPGAIAALLFLVWHYDQVGWTGYHTGSPWASGFERSTFGGLLRNTAVLAWRWLDFGRIVEWIVILYLFVQYRRKRVPGPPMELMLLAMVTMTLSSPSALLYNNLSAHRYFMPAYTAFHLFVFSWIVAGFQGQKAKTIALSFCIAVLISGHAWIYPRGISMDWDCTLAHRGYHKIREDMLQYLDAKEIDLASVGSAFPNLSTGEELMLNGDRRAFATYDLDRQAFILASNVFNDIDTAEYRRLKSDWRLEKSLERSGIWMELYRRKDGNQVK